MKYLSEINAFTDFKVINSLSPGQISLWFALMGLNNKCGWKEWFSVPNKVLEANTGLSQRGIYNARDILKKLGAIDFKYNGKKATLYKMNSLIQFYNSNDSSKDYANDTSGFNSSYGADNYSDNSASLYRKEKTRQDKKNYNKRKNKFNNYDDENVDDYRELEENILNIMLSEDY